MTIEVTLINRSSPKPTLTQRTTYLAETWTIWLLLMEIRNVRKAQNAVSQNQQPAPFLRPVLLGAHQQWKHLLHL